jgi:uncharacterized protein (TIGR00296 family)
MDKKEGGAAVKMARQAVELWVRKREKLRPANCPEGFDEKLGVFVTLHTWPARELRGCIGFPEPVYPLAEAIVEAAVSATSDPRFPELEAGELDKIIVEVSVLTKPEPLKSKSRKDYPKEVRTGTDGLIVRKGYISGLLLPQVAKEWDFDSRTFLCHTCKKAGLPSDSWLDESTKVLKFQAEIFSEKKPGIC